MTNCLLVRHGHTEAVGRVLAGRASGTPLTDRGIREARLLADRLARRGDVRAIYSGPLDRARQTADHVASALALPVTFDAGFDEIDFGVWTGTAIDTLEPDPRWQAFNSHRTTSRIPSGDLFLDVQARIVHCLLEIAVHHHEQAIVAVTHGDVIRAALAAVAGIGLDLALRFDIDPGSITELQIGPSVGRVLRVNDTAHLEV